MHRIPQSLSVDAIVRWFKIREQVMCLDYKFKVFLHNLPQSKDLDRC